MPIWLNGAADMNYVKLIEEMEKKLPDRITLNRQDLIETAVKINPEFRETLFRNLLENMLKKGTVVRVGRNQYKKNNRSDKGIYQNQYSEKAQFVVEMLGQRYPLLDYRVWELNWLNEFWNHQIAQNKIFIEVERMGCDFVYTELKERHSGTILLMPNGKELYRYGEADTLIVDRLVSEAPKGSPEHFNTPLEKIIVDLFANRNLKDMVHIGEYARAIAEMFDKYYINQTKLFRYADRRNKKTEVIQFLAEEAGIEVVCG